MNLAGDLMCDLSGAWGHNLAANINAATTADHRHSDQFFATINMFKKILLLSLASQALGSLKPVYGPDLIKKPAHDDDKCVDVSRYKLTFDTSIDNICSFKVIRECTPRSEKVCVEVPKTECTMVAGYTCDSHKWEETVRCDTTENKTFTPKKCWKDGVEILKETKKTPHCETVTKQQCDSKWEINEYGQKVFASNENCKDVSWEDCRLVDKEVEEEVEVFKCDDDVAKPYLEPVVKEEEVTAKSEECWAKGGSVCTVKTSVECEEVKWTDCEEKVVKECQEVTIKVPHQEYDHLLRCINH